MRSENKIRKQFEILKNQRLNGGPYSELKSVAWHGTKQALEWVLEESDKLLTY